VAEGDAAHIEAERTSGAIRTDLILSAEIMAIALADLAATPLLKQAIALVVVSFAVTVGVYGVVALIVKMDDIGLLLARKGDGRGLGLTARVGRLLVKGMPVLLSALSTIGMAAMLWVGGGIIVHGLEHYHVPVLPALVHDAGHWAGAALPAIGGLAQWVVTATLSALVGLVVGAAVTAVVHQVHKKKH